MYSYAFSQRLCVDKRLQTPIKWEPVDVTPRLKDGKTTIPEETIESIKKNKVALKGPLAVSFTKWKCRSIADPADTHWKRPCVAESYSASYLQPVR
jgi:isocitrate dehydrogenase